MCLTAAFTLFMLLGSGNKEGDERFLHAAVREVI